MVCLQTLPLPSYTPSVVARTYKQVAQPYLALVTAYESNNTPDSNSVSLSKLVQQRFEAFQQVGIATVCRGEM